LRPKRPRGAPPSPLFALLFLFPLGTTTSIGRAVCHFFISRGLRPCYSPGARVSEQSKPALHSQLVQVFGYMIASAIVRQRALGMHLRSDSHPRPNT
jgi:hypothetical protein